VTNFLEYTGGEYDSESNLYYYRARYCDPTSGRFLSEDPVRFNAASNFYTYTRNRPTNFMDPSGLDPCPNNRNCPPLWLQELLYTEILANPMVSGPYWIAKGVSQSTGNTVVVGLSGNAGGSIWPGGMLGGSALASVGIAVDPCGNIGLAVSGQLGGGSNGGGDDDGVGYVGGGSLTYTHSPNIFGLNGTSPIVGGGGGVEIGGSVTQTLGGSTTVTVGAADGLVTVGGVKGTKVFPLVCPMNCK
jgi:RHS repeat-associated protein